MLTTIACMPWRTVPAIGAGHSTSHRTKGRNVIASITIGLLVAGCGAEPPDPARRCDSPADHALAGPDGSIIGLIEPGGATSTGPVWLEPLIDEWPVYE